jgi:hypothetical protein
MIVGLLRILGYQLPDLDPCCILGESRILRWAGSPLGGDLDQLTTLIGQVPDGVVWKDPAVAVYLDRLDLTSWDVVTVTRDPATVAASEARWLTEPVDTDDLQDRAADWAARVAAVPALVTLEADTVRATPLTALEALAHTLLGEDVSGGHRALAAAFVRGGGGYHCPFPRGCDLPVSSHQP